MLFDCRRCNGAGTVETQCTSCEGDDPECSSCEGESIIKLTCLQCEGNGQIQFGMSVRRSLGD